MSEDRARVEETWADVLEGELAAPVAAAAEPVVPRRARFEAPHAPWREVLLLAGLSTFGSVAMDMYLPALPSITHALGASAAAGQATIAVFLAGLALGQLVYGPLSDRFGRRPPMLLGVALYALATLGCMVAADMGAMTLFRLLQALGACGGTVIARAVVRDRYADHEVIHVFALLSMVFTLAPVLSPFLGGLVLQTAGWRAIFGVQFAFALAVGAWAFFALPESRSESTRALARSEDPARSYLALLAQPRLVGHLLTGALNATALFAYISSAPAIVITRYHVAPSQFGWVFGANALGMMAAAQVNARLSRRMDGRVLTRGALLASLAAALVLLACAWSGFGGLAGVLGPLFVVLSSSGFVNPNTTAGAMAVDRKRAGATAALLGAGFFGVGGLAGAVLGRLPLEPAPAMAVVTLGGVTLALATFELTVARTARREAQGTAGPALSAARPRGRSG